MRDTNNVLGKKLDHIFTEWTPFVDADIKRAFRDNNFGIRNIIKGQTPKADRFVQLCRFFGDLDPYYLLGLSNIPYMNGDSLEKRYNSPQGEQALAEGIIRIADILKRPICSIYRYKESVIVFKHKERASKGFSLATTLCYGHQVKTKIFYTSGFGVTGKIFDKFDGEVIYPTREHQTTMSFYEVAATKHDESHFLVILGIEDTSGEPIGIVKIEDDKDWDFASEEEFRKKFNSKKEFMEKFWFSEFRKEKLSSEGLEELGKIFKEIYSSELEDIKNIARSILERNPNEGEDSWWLRGDI